MKKVFCIFLLGVIVLTGCVSKAPFNFKESINTTMDAPKGKFNFNIKTSYMLDLDNGEEPMYISEILGLDGVYNMDNPGEMVFDGELYMKTSDGVINTAVPIKSLSTRQHSEVYIKISQEFAETIGTDKTTIYINSNELSAISKLTGNEEVDATNVYSKINPLVLHELVRYISEDINNFIEQKPELLNSIRDKDTGITTASLVLTPEQTTEIKKLILEDSRTVDTFAKVTGDSLANMREMTNETIYFDVIMKAKDGNLTECIFAIVDEEFRMEVTLLFDELNAEQKIELPQIESTINYLDIPSVEDQIQYNLMVKSIGFWQEEKID